MIKIVKNDKKKRNNFFLSEKNQIVLKSLISNTNVSKTTRWKAVLKATKQPLTKNKLKNRCFLTGRKNIINKSYKSSRLKFFNLVKSGFIPGFKKSVW